MNNYYCPVCAVPVKHAPSSNLGMFHIILRKHVVHVGNTCVVVRLHILSLKKKRQCDAICLEGFTFSLVLHPQDPWLSILLLRLQSLLCHYSFYLLLGGSRKYPLPPPPPGRVFFFSVWPFHDWIFHSRGLRVTPLTPRNFHDFSTWSLITVGNSNPIKET